jgi:hypothetical protein
MFKHAVLWRYSSRCSRSITPNGEETESADVGDKDNTRLGKIAPNLIVSFLGECNGFDIVGRQFHFAGDDEIIAVTIV